jgi:hypothetical protein
MSNSDYFSDDPANYNRPKSKKRFTGVLALIAALIGGTFYIQSTLAANISLNSGSGVEFGQGITQTVACSGSNSITITPLANFVNSSGAGTFKFSNIRVDDIPVGCRGSDFVFSAYDNNAGSVAQALFNSTSSRAIVYIKNDGTFEMGTGGAGATVTRNSSTSFTVNFTSPVALSSDVAKITVESTAHTVPCALGGACAIGETGPGGGTIFYYSAAGFSCGQTLSSTCYSLEAAPTTGTLAWVYDSQYLGWSGNANQLIGANAQGTAIGTGYKNTVAMVTQIGGGSDPGFPGTLARAYRGPNGLTDWYLPSKDELNALLLARSSVGGLGNFYYWASTEYSAEEAWIQYIDGSDQRGNSKVNSARVRAIRAF